MRISFSYSDVPPLEVAEANLLAVLEPRTVEAPRPAEALVEEALDKPIGASRVEGLLTPSSRVLLLVDDITRQTPAWALLPALLERLVKRGCAKQNIKILIAAGTHGLMTPEEVHRKLGRRIPHEYAVHLHHWKTAELVEIGKTADGTPIRVNGMLLEADFIIGVGMIVPHRVMGFTGGASIVQPGVSGPEVTGYTHWISALYPGDEILGLADNPVRREVEQIARQAGLRFIVNVVMDGLSRVIHVVAGDLVAAHRQGAGHALEIWGAPLPVSRRADIVVSESYPADYDLWQAAKGIYSAELAVREGGVVVLITPCPHGVSDEHPDVARLGYHGPERVRAMLDKKEIADRVAAAHLAHVGRVIRDKGRGIIVSPGIPPETQRHLGFETAATPQEALERALAMAGRSAKIVVLRQGGNVMPVLRAVTSDK
jgi:nickel-dependent lactate racemase